MSVFVGVELARLAIRGDGAGAVVAFAEAPADGIVLQRPAERLPGQRGAAARAASRPERLALRARAETRFEQRRGVAQAMHGLARILRHQRFVGLQRALEIAIGAQRHAHLVEGDELRLARALSSRRAAISASVSAEV